MLSVINPPQQRRKLGAIAAVAVLIAATLTAAAPAKAADTDFEACLLAKHNQERAARGLGKLSVRPEMVAYARNHTQVMMDASGLFHSTTLHQATTGWKKLAENVGRGGSCQSLHDAFMGSPSHRDAILDPVYTSIGVGGDHDGSRYYVTVVFADHSPETTTTTKPPPTTTTQPAPTTTQPKPTTTTKPEAKPKPKAAATTTTTVPAETTTTTEAPVASEEWPTLPVEVDLENCEPYDNASVNFGGIGCVLEAGPGGMLIGFVSGDETRFVRILGTGGAVM